MRSSGLRALRVLPSLTRTNRLFLTRAIPEAIGSLGKLRELKLNCNKLHGQIPRSIAGMRDLRQLNLYNNRLGGPLPPGLVDLPQLCYVGVNAQRGTGDGRRGSYVPRRASRERGRPSARVEDFPAQATASRSAARSSTGPTRPRTS